MKKIKSVLCSLLALIVVMSGMTITPQAATLPSGNVTLHIVKRVLTEGADTTELIGNSSAVTGEAVTNVSGEPIEGVTYTIYKVGTLSTSISDVDTANLSGGTTVTTNADGKADFVVSPSDFGLYYVVETSAPDEVTATSEPFFVYLPRTNAAGEDYMSDVYVYPKNYVTLGGAILLKEDYNSGEALSGAKFRLYKKVGDEATPVITDYYGSTIGSNGVLTTGTDGYIYVNNLTVGEYFFVEEAAPDGYIINSDLYEFYVTSGSPSEVIVNADGTYTCEGIELLIAANSKKSTISSYVTSVGTTSDDTSISVNGTATQQKWITVAGIPSDMSTTYTEYKITNIMDEELSLVSGSVKVYIDDSIVTEDFTVSSVDTATNSFVVEFSNMSILAEHETIKIEYNTTLDEETVIGDKIHTTSKLNYKTDVANEEASDANNPYVWTGGRKFKVTDSRGNGISGAKFDVYTQGGTKVGTVTSDSNGTFEIKGFEAGTYYLVQTKATSGYELLSGKYTFEISATSYSETAKQVVNLVAPSLPITGGMGTVLFTIVGLACIALSIVLMVVSKKSKKLETAK